MKLFLIFLTLLLFGLSYLFVSCGKYPTQSDSPYGETILAKNLKIIDNMKGIELYRINPDHIYYIFETSIYYTDSIEIGDIIIGTAFGGYVRRVTGLNIFPQRLELRTESATLADAIINGGIDATLNLTTGDGIEKGRDRFDLVSAAKAVSLSEQ